MRQFIIASHAHFAEGINEALELLAGERGNLRTISMFVDGNMDAVAAAEQALSQLPQGDEAIVVTDLLGGSVNNEFLKIAQKRDDVYLITNMNLPLLLQLVFADEDKPTAEVIRQIVEADETRVKFVNDVLAANAAADEDEDF